MSEHLNEEQLNGLVDGALNGTAREAAERHLAECESCRRDLRQAQTLVAQARALPRSIDPPADLWPGIAPQLAAAAWPPVDTS